MFTCGPKFLYANGNFMEISLMSHGPRAPGPRQVSFTAVVADEELMGLTVGPHVPLVHVCQKVGTGIEAFLVDQEELGSAGQSGTAPLSRPGCGSEATKLGRKRLKRVEVEVVDLFL